MTSYAGLAVVRVMLGLIEGPMFPGIVLYLPGFYTRKELSLRLVLIPTHLCKLRKSMLNVNACDFTRLVLLVLLFSFG